MKLIALTTAVLLGTPFAAMAGGPVTPTIEPPIATPAPVMTYAEPVNWTGFYIGGSLGGGNSYFSTSGHGARLGVAGIDIGYRQQNGKLVLGGELSYEKDNVNQSISAGGNGVSDTTALNLIVGTPVGRTLVYGTVGIAQANATFAGFSHSDNGYNLGVGADYAMTQQWTLGGELLTSRYNDFNNTGFSLQDTTLKVKVGFRF